MLSIDPRERPPARAILKHPIFWQTEKVLAFFQDVSDRVEKDSSDSVVLQSLERSAYDVVRGNWKLHIEEVVMNDLKRHRTYQSRSVRDLLRALRNKVNIYFHFNGDIAHFSETTARKLRQTNVFKDAKLRAIISHVKCTVRT